MYFNRDLLEICLNLLQRSLWVAAGETLEANCPPAWSAQLVCVHCHGHGGSVAVTIALHAIHTSEVLPYPTFHLSSSPQPTHQISTIIIPILQMGKQRLRAGL